MNNGRKISLKLLLALIFATLLFTITIQSSANYSNRKSFYKILTALPDTIPKTKLTEIPDSTKKDSLNALIPSRDTTITKTDSNTFKISKDSLDAQIEYTAADSVVLDVPNKKITLYNKSNTKYKDLTLDANKIELDQTKQNVVATYSYDTTNQIIGGPKMVQGGNTMEADSITYDLKTQKGITNNTYTQSGEMYVHGDKM